MVRLQSLDDGVGFLRSEREVKGLEAIGLRSEKSLELMTAMSSGSSLREVSLHDCLLDLVEPSMLSMAFSNLVKVKVKALVFFLLAPLHNAARDNPATAAGRHSAALSLHLESVAVEMHFQVLLSVLLFLSNCQFHSCASVPKSFSPLGFKAHRLLGAARCGFS